MNNPNIKEILATDETAFEVHQRLENSSDGVFVSLGLAGLEDRETNGKTRDVIEVTGKAGSGKTEFAMLATVMCVLPPRLGGNGGTVLYFDSEFKLDAERLMALMLHHIGMGLDNGFVADIKAARELANECMEKVLIFRCVNSLQVLTTLHSFTDTYLGQGNVRLIVFDSIASFYHTDLETNPINTGLHISVPYAIRDIISRHHISIVATKPMLYVPPNQYTPPPKFLSQTWNQLVTTQILLEHTHGMNRTFRAIDLSGKRQLFMFQVTDDSGLVQVQDSMDTTNTTEDTDIQ